MDSIALMSHFSLALQSPFGLHCCSPPRTTVQNCNAGDGSFWNLKNRIKSVAEWDRGLGVSMKVKRQQQCGRCVSARKLASTLTDLKDLILQGPLVGKIGVKLTASVANDIDEWVLFGNQLSQHLGFDATALEDAERVRIYQYYLPIFFWCREELASHRSRFPRTDPIPPLVIGISAPQGCGKTTLVDSLHYLFNSNGSRAASISIDDFYLTATNQIKLAEDHAGNSLLELRGNAGSHDLQLGTNILKALVNLTSSGTKVKVPRYDKSARSGRGDRADPSSWPELEGPLEVVLFEGWMLGFECQVESFVQAIDPQLEIVNRNLAAYHDAWDRFVDSWIIVRVGDPSWVFEWRLEAEIAMKAKGKEGMTDNEVEDFVSRYMPAYKAYLPALYQKGPKGADKGHVFQFDINLDRNPIG